MSLLGKHVLVDELVRIAHPLLDEKGVQLVDEDGVPQEQEAVDTPVKRLAIVCGESDTSDELSLFIMRAEGGVTIKKVHASEVTPLDKPAL